MKLWNILNWAISIGMLILVGSILFSPLPKLSAYGFPLLLAIIGLGALSLIHSVYEFVRSTPKRRWAEPKPEVPPTTFLNINVKTWKTIGEWAFWLVILFALWQFRRGALGSKECPDIVRGNPEGAITVQYFYSPFCPACWKGEQVLQQFIKKYPRVRFENFDARYCSSAMWEAGVRGSPAYHFRSANASDTVYGADTERIENALCAVGGCTS